MKDANPTGPLRWGILATGGIAHGFAESLVVTPGADLVAVASRSMAKAEEFARKWSVARWYGTYSDLIADPNVDIVYVATPHHLHHGLILEALGSGKHVMCEKPLTLNAAEAREVFSLAALRQRLVVEAVWMRFIPAIVELRRLVSAGLIGDVQLVTAEFCFYLPWDAGHRLYDREVGGGALLDLGIYPLSFATMLLGFPDEIQSMASIGASGVDETDLFQLAWASGARAQLSCSLRLNRPMAATISGTKGWISVPAPFLVPDRFTVHLDGGRPDTKVHPYTANGYVHEIKAFNEAVRTGRSDVEEQTTEETLAMMELMDRLRSQWGLHYPTER